MTILRVCLACGGDVTTSDEDVHTADGGCLFCDGDHAGCVHDQFDA